MRLACQEASPPKKGFARWEVRPRSQEFFHGTNGCSRRGKEVSLTEGECLYDCKLCNELLVHDHVQSDENTALPDLIDLDMVGRLTIKDLSNGGAYYRYDDCRLATPGAEIGFGNPAGIGHAAMLASCPDQDYLNKYIFLFDASSGTQISFVNAGAEPIESLAISPEGHHTSYIVAANGNALMLFRTCRRAQEEVLINGQPWDYDHSHGFDPFCAESPPPVPPSPPPPSPTPPPPGCPSDGTVAADSCGCGDISCRCATPHPNRGLARARCQPCQSPLPTLPEPAANLARAQLKPSWPLPPPDACSERPRRFARACPAAREGCAWSLKGWERASTRRPPLCDCGGSNPRPCDCQSSIRAAAAAGLSAAALVDARRALTARVHAPLPLPPRGHYAGRVRPVLSARRAQLPSGLHQAYCRVRPR